MYQFYRVLFLLFGLVAIRGQETPSEDVYNQQREALFQLEESQRLGSSIQLTTTEEIVNKILMGFKEKEFEEGVGSNGEFFGATNHFFHSKNFIDASNVYKIIQIMPKGAALHMHDVTVGSSDFVAVNLTTWDNLYCCTTGDGHLLFRFFPSAPAPTTYCDEVAKKGWKNVADLRKEHASSPGFVDEWFKESMSMYTPTPEVDYPNTDRAWYHFERKITTISGVALHEPALRAYYYETMRGFYEDNVQYIEMRGLLEDIYRLDQSKLTFREALRLYHEVTEEFKLTHPDFWGAKYIFAPHRFHPASDIQTRIDESVAMQAELPGYFAGFDLVGQEDKGTPLKEFLPQLLDASSRGIKFFFHSGETGWHGTKIDENLIDAVLLNTTRIGHGYALTFHPTLTQMVKEKGIGVEACPISNQVLGLVNDFRNHPATSLMREGFPLVIASDGPGMWGSSPLSHDYYIAFMALAGRHADLKFLKQITLNSIEYSAMTSEEKAIAREDWDAKWSIWLEEVIGQYLGEEKENQVLPN